MNICDIGAVYYICLISKEIQLCMNATYELPKHYIQKLTPGYENYSPWLTRYIYTQVEHLGYGGGEGA